MAECYHCGGSHVVRDGRTSNGKQRFRCRGCSLRLREHPGSNAYSPERREEILRTYQERTSLRGLTRIFGVSRQTVTAWLKKVEATSSPLRHAAPGSSGR